MSRRDELRTWWRRTTTTFLGVSFGLTGDVVDTYHWDVLVTYHREVVGCFIWDLFETPWRRIDGTSLLCPFETSLQRSIKTLWGRATEMSWRRSIDISLGVSLGTQLWRHWDDVQRDVVTTLTQCLNAVWVLSLNLSKFQFCKSKNNRLHRKVVTSFNKSSSKTLLMAGKKIR